MLNFQGDPNFLFYQNLTILIYSGSSVNSDLTTPIPFIKNCVKKCFMKYRDKEILFNG